MVYDLINAADYLNLDPKFTKDLLDFCQFLTKPETKDEVLKIVCKFNEQQLADPTIKQFVMKICDLFKSTLHEKDEDWILVYKGKTGDIAKILLDLCAQNLLDEIKNAQVPAFGGLGLI